MIFRGAYNPITIPRIVHNYEQITDIPNLLFYYTASGLVTNTSNGYGIVDNSNKVSTLYSQVSPQINAIQLNGTTQPTLDIDGNGVKSVLKFKQYKKRIDKLKKSIKEMGCKIKGGKKKKKSKN